MVNDFVQWLLSNASPLYQVMCAAIVLVSIVCAAGAIIRAVKKLATGKRKEFFVSLGAAVLIVVIGFGASAAVRSAMDSRSDHPSDSGSSQRPVCPKTCWSVSVPMYGRTG